MNNNSNIGTAIKKIIDIEGDAILLNSRRFCAILDDLAIDSRKESKIIRRGITDSLLKMFYDARVGSISDIHTKMRRIEMYIQDELGLAAEWNNCIIGAFSDAFNFNYTPTICVESTTQLPSNHTEEPTVEHTSYENALLMGFMDYEMGKYEDARITFRSILMQDISCAGAYLGMLLICDKDEQMTYDQKFRQYATDHMSSFEKKIYTNKTKDSLLRTFLRHKDYNRISSALDLHGNITPELFYEAITQNPDSRLVQIFLDHGFDKNSTVTNRYSDGSDVSPIISQLMYNRASVKVIENLLKAGFNSNAERIFQNKSGHKSRYSLLSDSIWRSKDINYANVLLKYGANPEFVDKVNFSNGNYGEKSLLSEAVLENDLEMVSLLIDYGANVNTPRLLRTKNGNHLYSPLSDSIWNVKNFDIAKKLIQHGADVHFIDIVPTDGVYAEKPLISQAVLENNIDMVRLLLNSGADPNAERLYRNKYGDSHYSPLSDSIWKHKNIEMAKLLIHHGADVDYIARISSDDGIYGEKSILTEAVLTNDIDIVQLILDSGANINTIRLRRSEKSDEYYHVLSDSIWYVKNIDIARLLLENGCDASSCDKKRYKDGQEKTECMLHVAVEFAKSKEMVLLLIEFGASVDDLVTYKGKTIPFKRYPYQCGYPLNVTLEKIGWKGPKRFGLF